MIEIVLSLAHPSWQPKWQIDWFYTAYGRKFLYFTVGNPFPQNCPFSCGDQEPHLTRFVRPIRAHNPNGILIGSAVFAQMTAECSYTLRWDNPFPLKIAPSHGGSGSPSSTWFPGPTRVLSQTASWSVQPFLQGSLLWQTTLLGQ